MGFTPQAHRNTADLSYREAVFAGSSDTDGCDIAGLCCPCEVVRGPASTAKDLSSLLVQSMGKL